MSADLDLDLVTLDQELLRNLSKNVTLLNETVRALQAEKETMFFKLQEMRCQLTSLQAEQTKQHQVAFHLASALAIENLLCMRERYRR